MAGAGGSDLVSELDLRKQLQQSLLYAVLPNRSLLGSELGKCEVSKII